MSAYLDAQARLLETASAPRKDGAVALAESIVMLRRSLQLDPSNWLARFSYAVVVGHFDRHREARHQFEYLCRMIHANRSCNGRVPLPHLKSYCDKHPHFWWLVRYNYGYARAKLSASRDGKAEDAEEALGVETKLRTRAQEDKEAALEAHANGARSRNPSRGAAEVSANAAEEAEKTAYDSKIWHLDALEAFAHQGELEHLRRGRLQAKMTCKEESIREKIVAIERSLWNAVGTALNRDVVVYAHWNAQLARGRAHYLLMEYAEVERVLRWAVEIHMPDRSVDPFVALASLYINQRRRAPRSAKDDMASSTWAAKAQALLQGALDVWPDHTKAHYLLGRVLTDGTLPDLERAIDHFRRAGDDKDTHLWHARALSRLGRHDEAVRLLKHVLDARPTPKAEIEVLERIARDATDPARVDPLARGTLVDALNLSARLEQNGLPKRHACGVHLRLR